MPADKTQTGRRALQPACDACHVRRVKCSHDQPCAHCSRLGLTCTYTKAHTAKKTAGKRIEALRQAEKARQAYDHKLGNHPGAFAPPLPSVSSIGGNGWNSNMPPAPSKNGLMSYGAHHYGTNGPSESRFSPAGNDDRSGSVGGNSANGSAGMHHFYTNTQPGSSSPGQSGTASGSGMTWHPSSTSSPRGRSSMSHELDRQVRFQPQTPGSAHRQHYSNTGSGGNGLHTMPNPPSQSTSYGSFRSTQHMTSGGPDFDSNGGHPHVTPPIASLSDHSMAQHRPAEMPHEMHYLPSPASFFSNTRTNFEHGAGGSGSVAGTGLLGMDTSSSTTSAALSLDPGVPAVMDYLQGSILPPFSTSMADSMFNNQGAFSTDNLFNESSLPPLISAGHGQQTVLDMLGACLPSSETPGSVDSASIGATDTLTSLQFDSNKSSIEPSTRTMPANVLAEDVHPLADSVLIPTLALFYERLSGVMPVFSRNWIFSRLDRDDHQTDPHFASMLIAMSALTMIQAQPNTSEGRDKKADRISSRKRRAKATRLLEEALKLREGPLMGQHASLEMCCTSFFVFATLFGLGEHSAAWYRLRESITLAHICKLHEPSAYEGLAKDEAERRLRAYWLLAITERAFAIQRGMPIVLTGNPRASTASLRAKLGFKELSDFPDLQLRLFDHVDEKFVDCWNRKCQGPGCVNFDAERAIALWRSFTDGINQPSSRERSVNGDTADEDGQEGANSGDGSTSFVRQTNPPAIPSTPTHRRQIQRADVEVTRHWLLNRLWLITLNHGLLSIDAKDPPLRVDHAIHVAQSVYDVCDSLSLSAMEAHGVGFTYKLFDIAQTLVLLCKDEMIAEAISKGGVGEQLEKQTTAVHTSGRGHVAANERKELRRNGRGASDRSESHADSMKSDVPSYGDLSYGDPYGDESAFASFSYGVATDGPASLRKTVLGILSEYLTLFQRFRNGDHPYLDKLIELINELKAEMDTVRPSPSVSTATTTTTVHRTDGVSKGSERVGDGDGSMDEANTMHETSLDTSLGGHRDSIDHRL